MEKSTLSVLGKSRQIHDVEKESLIFLRDPFSVTRTDLIAYCLKELAEVLHLAVVHTYVQLPKYKSTQFYLIGYEGRTGWSNYRPKIYGDPEACQEGIEIKWLLKNLRWYWRKYAAYMELDDDAYDDITGFLSFDVVQNAYADCENTADDNLVQHCFEASLDLIIAISEATYYETIAEEVAKNRQNLEIMMPLVYELKTYQIKQKRAQREALDTSRVLEFLKCNNLIEELEREATREENPIDRPLTNYFLYTVMPRIEDLSLTNDSGVESGGCEGNTNTDEQIEEDVTGTLDKLVNQTMDVASFLPLSTSTYDIVPKVFANHTMDGSMIVINQFESTPITKQKENIVVSTIDEVEDEIDVDDTNKSEEWDRSFVLI